MSVFSWIMLVAVYEVRVTRETCILSAKKKKKKKKKPKNSNFREDSSQTPDLSEVRSGVTLIIKVFYGAKYPPLNPSHSFYTILHKNQPHKAYIYTYLHFLSLGFNLS